MYVTSEELRKEIILSKGIGKLTTEASIMLVDMVTKISNMMAYSNLNIKAYAISHSKKYLFRNWSRYNPDRIGNTYAYYSQIIKSGLASGYVKYHRRRYRSEKIQKILNGVEKITN